MTALPTIARAGCTPAQLAAADAWPEAELQRGVLQRSGAYDWRRVHFPAVLAVNRRGAARHLTAYVGDRGWPDTVLVHSAGVLVAAELKREGKYPEPDQRAWLDLLAGVPGVLAGVWRPRDWFAGVVASVLSDPERTAHLARQGAAA